MAQYRCAICGSPHVVKNDNGDSFSYKKALVGTAVFGTIGAVAGINGKKNEEYYCPDCGSKLKHPMDDTTRDMVDFFLRMPASLRDSKTEIFNRYSYLKKEIQQQATVAAAAPAYFPAAASDISQQEFMDAARAWYHAFSDGNDPSFVYNQITEYGRDKKYLPLEEYEKALKAARTITMALPMYAYMTVEGYTNPNGLGRGTLKLAVMFHTMDLYGDGLTGQDLYRLAQGNPELATAYQAVKHAQWRDDSLYSAEDNWLKSLSLYSSVMMLSGPIEAIKVSYNSYSFSKRYRLIDGELYMKAESPEMQFFHVMSKEAERIDKLEDKIEEENNRVSEQIQAKWKGKIAQLNGNVASTNAVIGQHQAQIEKLKKKIFGKKKALAEAEALNQQVNEKYGEIEKIKAEIATCEQKMADEQKELVEKACADVRRELDKLLAKKEEFIRNAPDMICLIGKEQA